MPDTVRTDKWLWATRFFKTRSLAARAAADGRISRAGHPIKPATAIQVGDILQIPFPDGPGHRTVVVTSLIESRVAASLAQACYEDRTEPAIYHILNEWQTQQKNAGNRPSKRERRQIGRIRGFFD